MPSLFVAAYPWKIYFTRFHTIDFGDPFGNPIQVIPTVNLIFYQRPHYFTLLFPNLSHLYLLAKNEDSDLYLIEKPEHTFKYTLNLKWRVFGLIHKGTYTSSYYSDSANTIEIPGRYIGDIRVERSWKDWLVYLDMTNFLDKEYEKYHGKPGNERVFRVGVQWDF